MKWFQKPSIILALIIFFSISIRFLLITQNQGQYFFVDEERFKLIYLMFEEIQAGNTQSATDFFIQNYAHSGFILTAMPAAFVNLAIGDRLDFIGISGNELSAIVLSLYSVANIALVYFIAKRLKASEPEALLATVFMAVSNTMFYYSQHFMPYDSSMFLTLLALLLMLAIKTDLGHNILIGALLSMSFIVYSGHWTFIFVIGIIYLNQLFYHKRRLLLAVIGIGIGGIFVIVIRILIDIWLGRSPSDFISQLINFSGTVTQGDFSHGWYFSFEFFWVAEQGMAIVWLVAILLGFYLMRKHPDRALRNRLFTLLFGIIFLLFMYALVSSLTQRFVVYGRLSRTLVPFVCLLSACVYWHYLQSQRLALKALLLVILASIGLLNIRSAFGWNFTFPSQIQSKYPNIISLPAYDLADSPVFSLDQIPQNSFILYGTILVYPFDTFLPPPDGEILESYPSPWLFLPYQYEGSTFAMRDLYREHGYQMMLIKTQP
jgi:hypothetical protein